MKRKCLECKNYYVPWRFCSHVEAYAYAGVSGSYSLRLDTDGYENEMLECNDFEPKKK